MNATPDTDIRAALADASDVAGLTFSTEAVLSEGHRVVRRRRAVATGLVAAATAVIAVVTVQLGTGQPRALPAHPDSSWSAVPWATGPLTSTTYTDGIKDGPGYEVVVAPAADGTASEMWTFFDGNTVVGTVHRKAPALRPGQARFLMPGESGRAGAVYGYVVTGPTKGEVMAEIVIGPDSSLGDGMTASLIDPRTQGVVGQTFMRSVTGEAAAQEVVGVVWDRLEVAGGLIRLGGGAALRSGRSGGVDAAVVAVNAGTSVLLWRDGDRFAFGARSGPLVLTDPGPLQVGVEPCVPKETGSEHDLAVGWVTSGPVELTSTDPSDAFTVSYGTAVGGRTPFVARSAQPDVRGTVTVKGGGETQTLAGWDAPAS